MAWTQSDIDTLKKAIASGVLSVNYSDGRSVTYRNLADMERILKLMQSEAAGSAATKVSYVGFDRG